MRLVKSKTTVTAERTVILKVPEDVPIGPMEIILGVARLRFHHPHPPPELLMILPPAWVIYRRTQ